MTLYARALIVVAVACLSAMLVTSQFVDYTAALFWEREQVTARNLENAEHRLLMTTVIKDAFASNRLLAEAALEKGPKRIIYAFTSPEKMEQTAKWMVDESKRKKKGGYK